MTYDALAMHAVRDELEATLVGGRIDQVFLIDARRVGLEIYAHSERRGLVFSLHPNDSRIYLARERIGRGTDQVTPFLLLLRKYVRGARILAFEQPRLERLLSMHISSRPDEGLPRELALVAEAMGRRSNLTLVDEDSTIMDVLDRVPGSVNPARTLLPHVRYVPPRAETKIDPVDLDLGARLAEGARDTKGAAWNVIIRQVAGMSPLAAQEVLFRAEGSAEAAAADVQDWAKVAAELATLVQPITTHAWAPTIAWHGEQAIAFAPYELQQFPGDRLEHSPSISDVVARAGAKPLKVARFDRLRQPLLEALRARADQLTRKRSSLERSLSAADDADALRWCGEAILANATQIQPGDPSLEWEGRRIDLYPTLSATENAQAYFQRYTDARDAKRVVPPLIVETTAEIAYLDEMALHVTMADSERDLSSLRRELESAGVLRAAPSGSKRQTPPTKKAPTKAPAVVTGPHRRYNFQGSEHRGSPLEGCEIVMGTSAVGNETVTFRIAGPDDLWFHVRGAPGAHVIVRSSGKEPRREVIEAAAQLAAAHSAVREDTRVDVDYTRRRYVRKIAGGAPGQVTYRGETTVAIRPASLDDMLAASGSK